MMNNLKLLIRYLFYEIPKDIWDGGKWDKEDHIETYYIDLYQVHEVVHQYSRLSHITALIVLNFLSLFDWRISISRLIFMYAYIKRSFKISNKEDIL